MSAQSHALRGIHDPAALFVIDQAPLRMAIFRDDLLRAPAAVLDQWKTWMRRHGIDPRDVAVPGFVDADDDAKCIRFETYARTADERILLNSVGKAVRTVGRVPLEGRPLPFPTGDVVLEDE